MKIKKFEDLTCWQAARELRKMMSKVTRTSLVRRDFVFSRQIRSAVPSVMANIAEGFESRTNKEFLSFLNNVRRSCGEVSNHLYAALDDEYIQGKEFGVIYKQASVTGKLTTGFINYLSEWSKKNER